MKINKTFYDGTILEDFIKSYFKEFHPAGYGTQIDEIKAKPIHKNGEFKWIEYEITISRLESCD